ncbi:SDR family oxidoreductase [Alicyclobacillus sp. TC]|uniref:NAD(P)-dependent dehydrogenase, short-chain alcohol dehydrogenase family n=2 Tax=Alicyclobacillus tolerans TaxID=90970 RepID=A0A1M6VZP0_9BACL|nr:MULTISPECIES: SDR family oxidoreductase [Alicyclobacillus]MDP9729085.1 NAD(P)-dependent dehydrogenase (short-subunit alcohol dehydrogenase family) [Alicyclobacillus tengchongensis]QRF24183.1 SDR family oxidoreductase [Alicyclobacillus sp. TC]SHK86920.1 NAD(P)-dependent dehydrogenase, short-chain alcohol dehydrogenase family [Alicyclobacillus montanus]
MSQPVFPTSFPLQHQNQQPGLETLMQPRPVFHNPSYRGSEKLAGKRALITGGDSGIGRAVATAFAAEGAHVSIVYLSEHEDANETADWIKKSGQKALLFPGDIRQETFCQKVVSDTVQALGGLDILINHAAEQHPQASLLDITQEQLLSTFQTNLFSMFFLTRAALPHLQKGAAIINTTSVTAYEGHEQLIDYSASKGAIVSFTRSLAKSLAKQGIRVNAVAPGPIWTPLIPSTFSAEEVSQFGSQTPLGRAGQPCELAPAYVYLASEDSSYMTGQVLHVNGGTAVSS